MSKLLSKWFGKLGTRDRVSSKTGQINKSDEEVPAGPAKNVVISVGIDFGTSQSGYAYSINARDTCLQFSWPAARDPDRPAGWPAPKTLTALLYDRATWQPIAWGMEARDRYQCIRPDEVHQYVYIEGFKLMLSDDPDIAKQMAHAPPMDFPHDAPTTIGHYLAFLNEHLMEQLSAQLGRHTSGRDCVVQYCVAIPAGWSEKAKYLMREAALQAGLIPSHDSGLLQLVYEPEAAALTTCKAQSIFAKAGEVLLIVDAGGGTVSFAMHEVEELDHRKVLSEATYRECLFQGSKLLDSAFEDVVADLFGLELYADEWCDRFPSDHLDLLYTWEQHKKEFAGESEAFIRLPLSLVDMTPPALQEHLAATAGYRDRMALSAQQMKEIFDVVVEPILEMVEQMVQRAGRRPDYLVLVGGLGSSGYLQRRLRERFGHGMGQIIIPEFAHAAVLQGTVLHLQQPEAVRQRISSLTYGFRAFAPMQPGWPEQLRYQATAETDKGFKMVLRKGVAVPDGLVIKHIVAPSEAAAREGRIRLDLLSSPDPNPEYIDDRVEVVGTIIVPVEGSWVPDLDKQLIELTLTFGATEIKVEACNQHTRQAVTTAMVWNTSRPVTLPDASTTTLFDQSDVTTSRKETGTKTTGVYEGAKGAMASRSVKDGKQASKLLQDEPLALTMAAVNEVADAAPEALLDGELVPDLLAVMHQQEALEVSSCEGAEGSVDSGLGQEQQQAVQAGSSKLQQSTRAGGKDEPLALTMAAVNEIADAAPEALLDGELVPDLLAVMHQREALEVSSCEGAEGGVDSGLGQEQQQAAKAGSSKLQQSTRAGGKDEPLALTMAAVDEVADVAPEALLDGELVPDLLAVMHQREALGSKQ